MILGQAPPGYANLPLDLATLGDPVAHRRDDDGSHIAVSDRHGAFSLWIQDAGALQQPAVIIPLDRLFELRLDMALRLHRRLRGRAPGPLPRGLQLTPTRRFRLITLLHALDFHLEGAGRRQIATALVDAKAAALPAIEWKSSAARRKTNRLVTDALALMNGGYLDLLRGD